MALSIVVRLRSGRYEAATVRPQTAEWPPAPARVFCALVASADGDADWAALQWLEEAGVPQMWASASVRVSTASGWVVTNTVTDKAGSQTWPGRSNSLRQRASVTSADDTFAVVWPDADADDATLARLVRLAARVPYVGRSTSSAEVTIVPTGVTDRPGWVCWQATELGAPGAVGLPVPYPTYTKRLREAFDDGRRSWETARPVAYRVVEPDGPQRQEEVVPSPFSRLMIFGLERGTVAVGASEILRVTEALRQATIKRVADPVPPQVSGHGSNGNCHVAFLGLPDVGHSFSDGHLLGVAVAVPANMTAGDRATLLRGLLRPHLEYLRIGPRQELRLSYAPARTWGLQADRWTGGPAGATRWTTATPIMLDRFPKHHTGAAALIHQSLVAAGYPAPAQVQLEPACAVTGGPRHLNMSTLSANRMRRPEMHAQVTFSQPVCGPVIAGALRYLGGGLFVPSGRQDGDANVR